jgi:sugar phosphate isomerase/epimerase
MTSSRREFFKSLGGALGARMLGTRMLGAGTLLTAAGTARAYPLGLAPGLQLWTVREPLEADETRTLAEVARIGYRELELYTLPKSPVEFKKRCDDFGLRLIGCHVYLQSLDDPKTLATAQALGLRYLIVVFPTLRAYGSRDISAMSVRELMPLYEKISADDYRWNAEQFNRHGAALKKAGVQLGYHNHAVDLKRFGNDSALDILIQSTDPKLVVFEMDCGHVIHAGADPVRYLERYPRRIQLLHLKDLQPGFSVSSSIDTEDKDVNAELGKGVIDWPHLFQVAAHGNVKHYFVEHEGAMADPPLVAIANSLQYLRQIT